MIGLEKEKSCQVSQIAPARGEDTAVRSIVDKKCWPAPVDWHLMGQKTVQPVEHLSSRAELDVYIDLIYLPEWCQVWPGEGEGEGGYN